MTTDVREQLIIRITLYHIDISPLSMHVFLFLSILTCTTNGRLNSSGDCACDADGSCEFLRLIDLDGARESLRLIRKRFRRRTSSKRFLSSTMTLFDGASFNVVDNR